MNIDSGDDFTKGVTFLIEVFEFDDTLDYVMEISLPDSEELNILQLHSLQAGLEEALEKIKSVIEALDAE